MRKILATGCLLSSLIAGAGLPQLVFADDVALADDAPKVYVVKDGDTLWDIASLYLPDPWQWQELWDINVQIDNPHLIFPGDELYLTYVDGQPRLRVRRGAQSRSVKLSPNMRVEPLDRAIPTISLEQIGSWISGHRIVTLEEMALAPYVVAGTQRHLLSASGDLFYARGTLVEDEVGYGIYRRGELYVDPVTEEILGLQAQDIGSAILLKRHANGVNHLVVTRVTEEVRNGDQLIPNEARKIAASFFPQVPSHPMNASIIAVDGGVSQIGTWDIVAINKGEREGIEAGLVLGIYQTGEIIRDPIARENVQMPDSRAGLLMVFRTFEKMSYGIVLKSNRPLSIGDRVTEPAINIQ